LKFHIKGEPASVKSLYDQIRTELGKSMGWRKLMINSNMSQNGEKTVLEFNSRPAFLLRRNEFARIQLETMMTALLIQDAKGAWLEKTEV
jgi:hypothetical protein